MLKGHLRREHHGPSKKLLLIGVVLVAIVVVAAGGMGAAIFVYSDYADRLEPPESVSINRPYAGARIYDRNGQFLYEFVDESHGLRRPIDLQDVSPYLVEATVATEDSTFFDNSGVNVKGLARAAWENLGPLAHNDEDAFEGSGGSSITQQLVKNVYIPADERADRSVSRKLKETVYALELTRRYSKSQILEWYLNQISYGGIYYGVEAASEGYFGKPAKDLTLAEAALLAGLPQSPAQFDPTIHPEAAVARRNEVLDLLREHRGALLMDGKRIDVSDEDIAAAKQEPLTLHNSVGTVRAPNFVFSVIKPELISMFGEDALYQDGLSVTTTIDINFQDKAQSILESHIEQFEDISNSRNGANIVIAPQTGEIWSYIGSRDYWRDDIQGRNDNLQALNSPGSTFKPFVYLTSFLKLGWSPGTVILDSPVTFRETNGTTFSPSNPNHQYNGPITIRNSLGNSLNVTAFKTAEAVGVQTIIDVAKTFGFTTLTGHYGPSIAIGGVDLTAVDLTYGYSVLANNGLMRGVEPVMPGSTRDIDPVSILKVTDYNGNVVYDADQHRKERQVVPPEYAFMITSILTDGQAECITFGCGGIQIPGRTVAVKTGTSEPFAEGSPDAGKIGDTWAFGYTPDMVVGIWAGNSDNSPIVNIYSTSISYRAMRDILLAAYDGNPQTQFQAPPGLMISGNCGRSSIAIGCKPDLVINKDVARGSNTALDAKPDDEKKKDEEKKDKPEETATPEATSTPRPDERDTARGSVQAVVSAVGGSGAITIMGTANSPNFLGYALQYQQSSGGPWHTIGQWGHPVASGPLGALVTGGLPPGQYVVRLTVSDSKLGSRSVTTTVSVP